MAGLKTSNVVWTTPVSLGATCHVVASDAKAEIKAWAEIAQTGGQPVWVCDGVADEVEINAAITALSAGRTSYGTVKLIGTFTLADVINLASYTTLDMTEARIELPSGKMGLYSSGKSYIRILGGIIDGNDVSSYPIAVDGATEYLDIIGVKITNQGGAGSILVNATGAINHVTIDSCEILNSKGWGISLDGTVASEYLTIKNNTISGMHDTSQAFGIWFPNPAWDNANIKKIIGNKVYSNGSGVTGGDHFGLRGSGGLLENNIAVSAFADGFAMGDVGLTSNSWIITNNKSISNTAQGFMLYALSLSLINDNLASGNGQAGFMINGCGYNVFSGNNVRNNTGKGFQVKNDAEGIPAGSLSNIFSGNRAANNSVDFSEEGLSNNNSYQDGYVETVAIVGSGTKVTNNKGYVTENSSTATVANAATTVVVNHGLATTPTRVQISLTNNPTNDPQVCWVSTLTATQFTINTKVDPGATGAIFDWRAQVGEG